MKTTIAVLAAVALCAVGSAYADYSVTGKGTWPATWPKELEPLRKQASTFVGPMLDHRHYAIPFTKREGFESAWPHILKVKSKGDPVHLLRGPDFFLGEHVKAGVVVHCSPPGEADATYIELVVDGAIVDLNCIPLPADTPIVDERFKDGKNEPGAGDKAERPRRELTVDLGGGVKMELVLIPAGEFMMGDDKGKSWERPIHKATVTKPFYLGKYEVTQEQWEAVMGSKPSKFTGRNRPVDSVSWEDCQEFLKRLHENVGGGKFQLPTETQWEYACRAGSKAKYSFGDAEPQLNQYAWYGTPGGTSHPVGKKRPNAWGLYDMHGNVWEWCQDWLGDGYDVETSADDSADPKTGSNRVFRGGSWAGDATYCRAASRGYLVPKARDSDLGFRVSRVLADE